MDKVEKHFNKVAKDYDYYKNKNSFYYDNIKRLLSSLIPIKSNILEIGCGTGDLLASLDPKNGYGMDLSSQMVKIAKKKHSKNTNLRFSTNLLIANGYQLDAIFMTDVIEHLEDPQTVFNKITKLMNKNTLFVNTMANPIWEPLLMLWEKLGWKMPEGPHDRIKYEAICHMLEKANLKVVKHDYKLLFPIEIPIITNFVNKYLEKYLKKYAFIEYLVAVRS